VGAADAASVAVTTSAAADIPTSVEIQRGLVLEGYGDGVMVTVYENSRYGNSLQVVIGDPTRAATSATPSSPLRTSSTVSSPPPSTLTAPPPP